MTFLCSALPASIALCCGDRSHIDTLDGYQGFDITGKCIARVIDTFPYKGQRNPILIEFKPDTIMNQADEGNQIVIMAPPGFIFPVNCTGFMSRRALALTVTF